VVIGYEESSQLDVEPAKYFVLVTKREKRACRSCEDLGVVSAPLPPRIIASAHRVHGLDGSRTPRFLRGDCIARGTLGSSYLALACLHIDWGFIRLNVTSADQFSPHCRADRDQQLRLRGPSRPALRG